MKIHNILLHRRSEKPLNRISPTAVYQKQVAPLPAPPVETPEVPQEKSAPPPEDPEPPKAKSEDSAEEVKTSSDQAPAESAEASSWSQLLSLNSTNFGAELETGKYDGSLKEILAAEETGKNRRIHKSKIEERIAKTSA